MLFLFDFAIGTWNVRLMQEGFFFSCLMFIHVFLTPLLVILYFNWKNGQLKKSYFTVLLFDFAIRTWNIRLMQEGLKWFIFVNTCISYVLSTSSYSFWLYEQNLKCEVDYFLFIHIILTPFLLLVLILYFNWKNSQLKNYVLASDLPQPSR